MRHFLPSTFPVPVENTISILKISIKAFVQLSAHSPILKANRKIICKTYNDNNLIFPSSLGNYISPSHFRNELNKLVSIKFKLHSLRHTHASLCIDKGIAVEYISKRLGHEDTKVTQRIYIHKTKKSQKKEFDLFKDISF